MYLSDYHTHCRWSEDARVPMAEMTAAAVERGLREICFTDHVEVMLSGTMRYNVYDWPALEREYAETESAWGERIAIRRGAELGEAPRDFAATERLLDEMPAMDFLIGSIHQLSGAYDHLDLIYCAADEETAAREQIRDYLELVLQLARWGRFSVLGHLTLPLRYMNERRGLHMSFDGFEAEVAEIFRTLIENGCGIEVNTNRGHTPLPGAKWLRLYRELGGEIVTVGTDAHTPEFVGCAVAENYELLRACGFRAVCTYEALQPVFHDL